jgi:ribosome-binding factor A
MSRRRQSLADVAADLGPDDLQDPKAFHDRRVSARGDGHVSRKGLQLCGQVRDALTAILPGLADEALRDLTVVSVEPAPHTGRLMVTVAVPRPADATDRTPVADRLHAAASHLRTEVAAAVHRRRAPELAFRLI